MNTYVNYWKVKDNVINRNNSNYIYSLIGGNWSRYEIKDKAKELYDKYKDEWEGILLRVIRTDAWSRPTNSYYLYYDGKKFIKNPEYIYFDNADIINFINYISNK